jgi:D-amino-acid dehydrogenase
MSRRIVVVGGGVVGLCVAHACAQRGHRVVVLERGAPERDGCSFANAGMLVPSHFIPLASPGVIAQGLRWMWDAESPFHVKPRLSADLVDWAWKLSRAATPQRVARAAPVLRDLHLASRAIFEQWAAQWDDGFGLVGKGLLMLCRTEEGLAHEARLAEQAQALGMPAEVLTAFDIAAREPEVRMTIAGGVYFPLDGHLVPCRLMAVLRRETQRLGVELRHGTDALGWRVRNERIDAVRTATDELEADEFALCGGIWSTDLAAPLGLRLPMQAGKGYSLTLDAPPTLLRMPAILTEARVAVTPMGRSLRVGGTMEIAGIDETINPARIRGIVKSAGEYYPDLKPAHFASAEVRTGLRPCSPDGLPYIGRVARYANLAIATGHAMMGVSLAPITGKLIAEIVSAERPSLDLDALSPDRYADGFQTRAA